MKRCKFLGALGLGIIAMTVFNACEDGDNVIDDITENETRGAILRTISIEENEVLYDVGNSTVIGGGFSVILEEQDQEGGDLLASVDVFFGFRDNTEESGTGNDREEILAGTIPASDFSIGEFGLPRTTYTVTAEEIQTALNVPDSEIFGGDQFTVRFELVLTDGRRYSFADNSGTLTGSFFSAPFLYTANIVCAPSIPTSGDWIFDLQDSFGDGFNGANISVSIDGEVTTVDLPSGSEGQVIVNVPDGASTISIIFNSGSFDEEITFQVTSANGNTVVDIGPNPPVGAELLDFCPNNL